MTPEEYDKEKEYYYDNFDEVLKTGLYKPLWKQNKQWITVLGIKLL